MGLMLAEPGYHTRCFVEWEPYPRDVIAAAQRAGYFAPAPIWDDVNTFDATPFAGAFDTIVAGYPCQPFSHAGQRKGECDPRHLWPAIERIIRELGPGLRWAFFENVAGHILASVSKPCSLPYVEWVSSLRWAYSQRKKSALRTSANGSSSWPTAKAATGGANSKREDRGAGGPDLQEVSQNWPTPMAGTPAQNGNNEAGNSDFTRKMDEILSGWSTPRSSDADKGGPNQSFGAGGIPLPAQAANWPTPASRDHKGENSSEHMTNAAGRKHMDQLPNFVTHSFSRPVPTKTTHGVPSSKTRPTSRRLLRSATSHITPAILRRWLRRGSWRKKRLNPNFVEWLMGWPPGHALCDCSGMEWSRYQRRMRGALSALPTASAGWIWEPRTEANEEIEQMEFEL